MLNLAFSLSEPLPSQFNQIHMRKFIAFRTRVMLQICQTCLYGLTTQTNYNHQLSLMVLSVFVSCNSLFFQISLTTTHMSKIQLVFQNVCSMDFIMSIELNLSSTMTFYINSCPTPFFLNLPQKENHFTKIGNAIRESLIKRP